MSKLQPTLRFPEFKENWEIKKLDDLCSMQAGKFINASDINEANEEYVFPCYGGNGLRGFTKTFNYEGQYSLIGRQGALCGNITLASNKFYATEHAVVVTVYENIDTIWMYYLLNILNLNQYATGQAQPGLSVQNIKQVETVISKSIPEQTKIATFLSAVDEKINLLKEKKALLEEYKKGMMQKIFSQELRFKDENGKEFADWEEKSLGEISSKPKYGLNSSAIDYDGKNGYLRITDIDEQSRRFLRDKITSPDIFDDSYLLVENDLLFTRTGSSTGKSYLYDSKDGKLYFAGFLIKFNIHSTKAVAKFIFYQTLLSAYDKWVRIMSMRSGQPGINAEEYSSLQILLPCLEEQTKIASFLSAIDEKIELVTQQMEDTQEYKKGLLQGMFC